jgi:hypothetical protein
MHGETVPSVKRFSNQFDRRAEYQQMLLSSSKKPSQQLDVSSKRAVLPRELSLGSSDQGRGAKRNPQTPNDYSQPDVRLSQYQLSVTLVVFDRFSSRAWQQDHFAYILGERLVSHCLRRMHLINQCVYFKHISN